MWPTNILINNLIITIINYYNNIYIFWQYERILKTVFIYYGTMVIINNNILNMLSYYKY